MAGLSRPQINFGMVKKATILTIQKISTIPIKKRKKWTQLTNKLAKRRKRNKQKINQLTPSSLRSKRFSIGWRTCLPLRSSLRRWSAASLQCTRANGRLMTSKTRWTPMDCSAKRLAPPLAIC